jgi:hypothetical protein
MTRRPVHPSTPEARAARRTVWWTKAGAGVGLVVSLLLATAAWALSQVLAQRHFLRRNFSRDQRYELSQITRELLATLTNNVEITLILRPGVELDDVTRLLAEYQASSPRIRVRRYDPDRDVARVTELARRWPISQVDCIVVTAEDRLRVLDPGELYALERLAGPTGVQRIRRAFRGERVFTTAIYDVTHAQRPVIYVLAGHGEYSIEDPERLRGLAAAARRLQREGFELRTLVLTADGGVPTDAAAILIPGPRTRFAQPELDQLQAYLERNGRALILLGGGRTTGLESWLRRWGVVVGDDRVVDGGRNLGGGLLVTRFIRHGVTERIHDLACVFYEPRSVEPAPEVSGPVLGADRPRVTRLALTSDRGWAETDYLSPPWTFDEGRDRRGPVCMAVAVERGSMEDLALGLPLTRVVVVGDSAFAANGAMVGGNEDFLVGAVNWLVNRHIQLDIPERPIEVRRIEISRNGLRWLAITSIGGVPGLVAVLAGLIWWRRRA